MEVRELSENDIELVCRHREEMFRDAGRSEEVLQVMTRHFRGWLRPHLHDRTYFGFVVCESDQPIAGIGLMLIDWPPHPARTAGSPRCPSRALPKPCGWSLAHTRLFFDPVEFHLQLANLAVQSLRLGVLIDRLRPALPFEKFASLGQDLLLVLPHLHRVHAVFLGNFVQRLQPTD